ncbi:hypothetical protein HYH03_017416 [Edaphochlamys debaryana]|uniref:Uncharacterized protein n=1 Tax=Edaphochlamys debaryana TaxID=47281 RepID=A0A836BNY5_9CHLO|nr:hypothetical protein HYH03_017416 [Edaphochlamys debaryana]|eukprot:KAG2483761.1 hypothetical protein HYH03_017416 [Edaphochlamys debaryana]
MPIAQYTALGGAQDPSRAHHCVNMVTLLQVRHPHTRVLSHIRHVWARYSAACGQDRVVYLAAADGAEHWVRLMPAPTNSYLIRTLLGEAVYHLPPGAVTRDHLGLARVLLAQQVDVLTVLEDAQLSSHALRYGLGWRHVEERANTAAPSTSDLQPRSGLELLWELNALDMELYGFAAVLAAVDAVVYDVAGGVAVRLVDGPDAGPGWAAGAAGVGAQARTGDRSAGQHNLRMCGLAFGQGGGRW